MGLKCTPTVRALLRTGFDILCAWFDVLTDVFVMWIRFDTHRISFDEGREWTQYSFSPVPLFVDGVLVEAGTENQIMT